jgi:hypothetical protein
MTHFTLADVQRTYKAKDAWWTVFLVDPLAGRLVVWTANRTRITPNQLTGGAAVLGLLAAFCFALATWPWLLAGALLFHLSFVLDCMDGKIARLKGTGSVFGVWVDFILDRVRFFVCMMALLVGQWAFTGEAVYLLVAPVVVFLGMLRYLNGSQVAKTRRAMHRQVHGGAADEPVSDDPEGEGGFDTGAAPASPESGAEGPAPRGVLARTRAALLRHRVRPHLFSGIEYEMFICVVAPATAVLSLVAPVPSLIVPVVVFAAVALAAFEAVIVARLWRSARRL